MKRTLIRQLMVFLAAASVSCSDDTSESTSQGPGKDMYLRVNIPCMYASGADGTDNKKTVINGIDVLVFAPGVTDRNRLYPKSASEGTPVAGKSTFQVATPVGEGLEVHIFTNNHAELARSGAYKGLRMEMNALLEKMVSEAENDPLRIDCLSMHSPLSGVTVSKESVGRTPNVLVLHSVAAVQAKVDDAHTGNPGELLDSDGKVIFKLCESYACFPVDSGRLAPLKEAYEVVTAGSEDEEKTRNVVKTTLPTKLGVRLIDGKLFLRSEFSLPLVGPLYLYESTYYSDDGFDQPGYTVGNDKVATTRLVVSGIYGDDADVIYYRIDLTDPDDPKELVELLYNHKYAFQIMNVSGSGYDNPDNTAMGVPMNIYVKVIDWIDMNTKIDSDREDWFFSGIKRLVLSGYAGSLKSTPIESDVAFGPFQELSSDASSPANGNATIVPVKVSDGAVSVVVSNERCEITIAAGMLTVKAKKSYGDLAAGEAYDDDFYIKVKNLTVHYKLIQVDRSPDDWGNGGSQENELHNQTQISRLMKRFERNIRRECMFLSVFCLIGVAACSSEEGCDIQPVKPVAFTLNYTIPDADNPEARASDIGGKIPVAYPEESVINDVRLSFFIYDEHGNGLYAGFLQGIADGNRLAKTGKTSVIIPESGSIDNHTDYNVLVPANASVYSSGMDFGTYCSEQTENSVRVQLREDMPLQSIVGRIYTVMDNSLFMSGITLKEAGKDMSVQLLCAVVHIDIRVAEDKRGTVLLKSVMPRNVSPVIPVFGDPQDMTFLPLTYANEKNAPEQSSIIGGLYITEVLCTLHTPYLLRTQAACLLLQCEKSPYKGWYRVNINIDKNDMQYLRRNNAYTVIIKDVLNQGADTPNEAYGVGSFGIKTVIISTDWKVPDGTVTPSDVEVS